jgi:hypothetical protein
MSREGRLMDRWMQARRLRLRRELPSASFQASCIIAAEQWAEQARLQQEYGAQQEGGLTPLPQGNSNPV